MIKGRVLSQANMANGYLRISLGRNKNYLVHRLVCTTFKKNPLSKPCVNHIDCNKKNNRSINLQWCTYSENEKHSYKNGKTPNKTNLGNTGVKSKSAKQIAMYKNNKCIRVFGSASECARKIKSTQGSVSRICRGEADGLYGYNLKYISRKTFYKLRAVHNLTNPVRIV